ncbi:MAG: ureidoglycolate lyase [Rhodobacteraceae bacterium]|nr:ureidoglycolate lyase [Paracoccaceae bacterium]
MSRTIAALTLEARAFAPFGEVLAAEGPPDRLINAGRCGRWHDRAGLDFGPGGRAGISLFRAEPSALPHGFDLLERHPEGSQAFLPMAAAPFLVIVAADEGGVPGTPMAFRTLPGQGVNLRRGVWHGVLTPLAPPGLFAVVDRIGAGATLEEFRFPRAWTVTG